MQIDEETVTDFIFLGSKINADGDCSYEIERREWKVGLKLDIQKTKIMASGPITSSEVDGDIVETVADFIFGGLQNHCRWWLQPWN